MRLDVGLGEGGNLVQVIECVVLMCSVVLWFVGQINIAKAVLFVLFSEILGKGKNIAKKSKNTAEY